MNSFKSSKSLKSKFRKSSSIRHKNKSVSIQKADWGFVDLDDKAAIKETAGARFSQK